MITPTHVGVFLRKPSQPRSGPALPFHFSFVVGSESAIRSKNASDLLQRDVKGEYSLARLVKLPRRLSQQFAEFDLEKNGLLTGDKLAALGFVSYDVVPRALAVSASHYPRYHLRRSASMGKLRGLGYYLSLLAESHLRKEGVSFLATSSTPLLPRRKQLARVGLPVNKPVPINAWLRSMGRGVRESRLPASKK